jgi:hypothetical protein
MSVLLCLNVFTLSVQPRSYTNHRINWPSLVEGEAHMIAMSVHIRIWVVIFEYVRLFFPFNKYVSAMLRRKVSTQATDVGRTASMDVTCNWQLVEELNRADRRITLDSVATALGCSHGSAYRIVHDHLKFRKVWARWVLRERKDRKKITEWVRPRNVPYIMQMEEKICLTGLILGTNHGCITTNPNQSVLQCNGKIKAHLVQPKSLRLRHHLGRLCVPCFRILREYC